MGGAHARVSRAASGVPAAATMAARLLLLGENEQHFLVRVQLGVVALAHAAQLLEVLRPLLAQQVRLAGVVAQELAGRGDLEALRGAAVAPGRAAPRAAPPASPRRSLPRPASRVVSRDSPTKTRFIRGVVS